MKPFQWLYLDLNSFFASVEQQLDPSIRGKPVAVVPMLADTTSVIAASIEAKKFGVKTGTRVSDAKRICPGIIFRASGHQKYIEAHQKIIDAVEKVLPITAVCSIDEMACRLMGREQEETRAVALAHEIKKRIRSDAGDYLSCSVGLAPNRYLAKVATDMQKPDGLILIRKEELPQKLFSLELRDFPGIGPKTEQRIRRYGVETVEHLCSLGQEDMRLIWGGINGEQFFKAIRGEDYETPETKTKSISHSNVLSPEFRHLDQALLIAQKLLHKAAARLRESELWCAKLSLSISYIGQDDSFEKSETLIECCDDLTLIEALRNLWKDAPRGKPLKVGVVLSNLVEDSFHTLSLFANPRREKLAFTLDSINQRFGRGTLNFASMKELSGAAPTRIAFTNIPKIAD